MTKTKNVVENRNRDNYIGKVSSLDSESSHSI